MVCPADGKEVHPEHIVKGYELEKDQYVVVRDEELESCAPEKSKAIDITDLPNNAARRGHMVTLLGEGITVDELAHHFGTIGYEVLTSLGPRYARVYKGGATAAEPAASASA